MSSEVKRAAMKINSSKVSCKEFLAFSGFLRSSMLNSEQTQASWLGFLSDCLVQY
jgi:hypothetical protein